MFPPGRASPVTLQGAALADRQSRIRGALGYRAGPSSTLLRRGFLWLLG